MADHLAILNPSPRKLSGATLLHQLVFQGRDSNRTAIHYRDAKNKEHSISYNEFHARSNALAAEIVRASKKTRQTSDHFIVPLLLPQCPELYITQLAILKAGGAFCPLPVDAPEERLRFILKDTSASLVISNTQFAERMPKDAVQIIDVQNIKPSGDSLETAEVRSEHLAYVMYTSGSTGLPKGVLLSHGAATQALLAHDEHIPPYSRFLQVAAPTFDVSVFEIFFTFFRGQTLVCCERTQLLADLPGTINSLKIDAAELTPSVASNLLGPREGVPGLKVLLTIGEMLKKGVVERFGGSSEEDAVLHGMYGPTEATIHCTLQPQFRKDMPVGNVGMPLATVSAFIVEPASPETQNDAPRIMSFGDEGELAVGGYQLANGYLNRDEQTRAAFVDHSKYGKLYRTGDKGRIHREGWIECLGRISAGQVKLRGQRMEVGEVEYAVSKTPGCSGAVAEVIQDTLVAFCQCDPEAVTEQSVLSTCKKWLPAFMVPSEIVLKSQLPYLPSGKIDRRSLRSEWEQDQKQEPITNIPQTNDERTSQISSLITNILGQGAIKGSDLQIGRIDSLTSIRIASGIGKLGYPQPRATQIMESRRIDDIVQLLDDTPSAQQSLARDASDLLIRRRRDEVTLDPLVADIKDEIEDVFPCSAVQSAMLTETSASPQHYSNWLEFEITNHSQQSVEDAVDRLFQSYQMLQAGFLATDSGWSLLLWKTRKQDQIQLVTTFNYDHQFSDERDLLTPCKIQLRISDNTVHMLLHIHHALYDQWSIDLLQHDLQRILDGHELDSPSYTNVLSYYSNNIDSAISDKALSYWQDILKGAEPTRFPNLNPIKQPSLQVRTEWLSLSTELELLRTHSVDRDWTPQAVFQAAFAYLLSMYAGSFEPIYGTVFSGRQLPISDIDRIFGPTLTTLPVKASFNIEQTCAELTDLLNRRSREMMKHSETPLSQIRRAAPLEQDQILFDTLFIWQESVIPVDEQTDIRVTESADYHEFKLCLEVEPTSNGIRARITYDQSLIPADQATRFVHQIDHLTQCFLTNPNNRINDISGLLPEHLLSISNPQPVDAASHLNLASELEKAAERNANRIALIYADRNEEYNHHVRQVSFSQLHKLANQLANHLIHLGAGSNDLVCICMEKSVDFYAAILAVIKTGAGYLPILPDTKSERIMAILQQAKVKVIITDTVDNPSLNEAGAPLVVPSEVDYSKYSSKPPSPQEKPSNIAYTVFTSGSTGTPKGVAVTRGNLLGNIVALQQLYEWQHGDRLLQACIQSFDVAVFEIFFGFLSGVTLCTATTEVLFEDLERFIRSTNVTHLSMTPTVAGFVNPDNVPSVRFLVTSGEAMTAAVHKAWAGRGLHQGYGPSETTNICTVNLNMSADHQLGSIGPPFNNTSAFVLDPDNDHRVLPHGAFGELAFGGEQVFRGYIGLDGLNRSKIIDHPQHGRIYRSGDLGRIVADGSILIHGRADFQVKIRGNRVELGEISSHILRCDFVDDCVSITDTHPEHGLRIVSFWKASESDRHAIEMIQPSDQVLQRNAIIFEQLSQRVPSYMMPTFILPLTSIPRTSQGKTDQRQLKTLLDSLTPEAQGQFSFQQDNQADDIDVRPEEHGISEVLSTLYKTPSSEIDRKMPFDAIGVNSINAAIFARALKQKLHTNVSISTVLRNSTVARLAKALSDDAQHGEVEQRVQINVFSADTLTSIRTAFADSHHTIEDILPCTPLQEAMLAAGDADNSSYYNTTMLKINGDIDRLKHGFEQAFERNAILRTKFVATNQADRPFAQVVFESIDIPWFEDENKDPAAGIGPEQPVTVSVTQTKSETKLVIRMHHATYDGTSMEILFSELEALYRSEDLIKPVPMKPFLAECGRQSGADADDFWSKRFGAYLPKPFPPLKNVAQTKELSLRHTLQCSRTTIESFCRTQSLSFTSVFETAWAVCLSMLQGSNDICFGNVVNGRLPEIHGIDQLMAPCFNTLPVRVSIQLDATYLSLLQQLTRSRNAAKSSLLTPLRKIQRLSRDPSKHLFDSLLLLQAPSSKLDPSIWSIESDKGVMGFPLVLELVPGDDKVELTAHYLTDRFAEHSVMNIVKLFDAVLDNILQDINAPVTIPENGSSVRGLLKADPQHEPNTSSSDDSGHDDDWSEEELIVKEILITLAKAKSTVVKKRTTIYQLGLDSLNAAQIAARLRNRGFEVDLADIMEHRTSSGIASVLRRRGSEQDSSDRSNTDQDFERSQLSFVCNELSFEKDDIEAIRTCTAVQQGMLAQSLHSDGELYINHIWFELSEDLVVEKIRSAFYKVVERHPILRTVFLQALSAEAAFMMIVLNTAQSINRPTVQDQLSTEKMEQDNTREIIADLTTPPWRATIRHEHGRQSLLLSIHHALYDADGLRVLQHDLFSAYKTAQIGPRYPLDKILQPINQAMRRSANEQEQFWKSLLQSSSFVRFPSLAPRMIPAASHEQSEYQSSLPAGKLESLCRERNCTVQAAGQAAWARLLSAYTGEPQVTFGTVFSSRSLVGDDDFLFPCINTLPVNVVVDVTSHGLLQTMVEYNAKLQRYRFTPLADVQRYAGRPAEALFDTVFVYQKSQSAKDDGNFKIRHQSAAVDYQVSLELEVLPSGEVLYTLSYTDVILPQEHAELLLRQFDHVLQTELQAATITPTSLLSTCSPKDRSIPSPFSLLHEVITHTAKQHPERTAIEFISSLDKPTTARQSWTYKQLDNISDRLANHLRQHGAKTGGVVAVCMEKSPEASFAFAAILKAGCAFLALDPDLPEARKQFILQDSSAAILLVDSDSDLKHLKTPTKIIDLTMHQLEQLEDAEPVTSYIDPQSVSYILYTSGSTGTPKGCEITHENAVQAMMSFQRLFAGHWEQSSRWLQFASYWFDVSVLEHFWSWSVGITMVGAPRDLVLSDLTTFINEANITHIDLTPSLARLLEPEDVPCLCHGVFITGGEALKQEIIQKWGTHKVICNGYGPTEATIGVTMNPFIDADAKPANIGQPFDNVGSFVVNSDNDQPVLRGAIGELCVFGKLVGKGYLNQPELTQKMFPTPAHLGERIYRTGDLVRQLANNSFLFIGRKDSQAKLRGQRLEIGEIDSIVKGAHSDIEDVTSMVVKSEDGNKQTLVSFFTSNSDEHDSEKLLASSESMLELAEKARAACKAHLPGYMVPTHIIPLLSIPLTVNKKVDAKKLSALYVGLTAKDFANLQGTSNKTQALDSNGERVAKVLAEMLSVDEKEISASTNIFSLGISSITAIQLVTRMQKAGLKTAQIALVMKNPEVGQLSTALSIDKSNSQADEQSIKQAKLHLHAFDQRYRRLAASQLSQPFSNVEVVTPCTPLQQGLLVESMNQPDRPYFNTFLLQLTYIERDQIEEALVSLTDKLQMLRAKFVETDEGYIQAIIKQQDIPARSIKCSAVDLQQRLQEARSDWLELNSKSIHNPWQVLFFETGDAEYVSLHVHHALYDGISFDLLLQALESACRGQQMDTGRSFTEILPYGPLRKTDGADLYWKEKLKDLTSSSSLPKTAEVSRTVVRQHKSEHALLSQAQKTLGVSHQAVVQTAFETAVIQTFNAVRAYGKVVSGRSLPIEGADTVIGPTFNTLPAVLHAQPDDTWATAARRCHDDNTSEIPYHHTALRDIKKWLGMSSKQAPFEILFVFQMSDPARYSGKKLWKVLDGTDKAEYPIAFEAEFGEEHGLTIKWVAQSTAADEDQLRTLCKHFDQALKRLATASGEAVAESVPSIKNLPEVQHTKTSTREPELNGVHNFTWTDEARALQDAIAQLLGIDADKVDEHSTIFQLGLDSIDAVKLASRTKKRGINVNVSTILKGQTIPRITAQIQNQQPAAQVKRNSRLSELEKALKDSISIDGKSRGAIERILPATPNQEGLLALMIQSDFKDYFNHDLLEVTAGVDLGKLSAAWRTVIGKHPILRTSFKEVTQEDIPIAFAQVVHISTITTLRHAQLSNEDDLSDMMDAIRQDVAESFEQRPPIRVTCIDMLDKHYILLSMAHALYDGHSLALLHADIQQAYQSKDVDRPSPDDAINMALQANNTESIHFWASTLNHASTQPFPRQHEEGKTDNVIRTEINSTLSTEDIRKHTRRLGISMQTLAQTTWSLILAHYTRSLDVVFGSVLACRDSDEMENVMFPMMNTVAMRSTIFGSRKDMLQTLQDFNIEMLPHKQTPLRLVQAAVNKENGSRQMTTRGLFDTLFIYQQRPATIQGDAEPLYESVKAASRVEYPVATEVEVVDDAVVIRTAVDDQTLSRTGAKKMLQLFDRVMQRLLTESDRAAVEFKGSKLSICGLPYIELIQQSFTDTETGNVEDAERDEKIGPSKEWDTVKTVLGTVAGLQAEEVNPSASLDSLGIDSISAIKVSSLLRKEGIRLKVSDLLKARTVNKIASLISTTSRSGNETVAIQESCRLKVEDLSQSHGLDVNNIDRILPATAGQIYTLGVWLTTRGRLFYPTFTYSLSSQHSVDDIRRAWHELVARHDILRTIFSATSNSSTPVAQVVLKSSSNSFINAGNWPREQSGLPMVHLRANEKENGWKLELKIHHALYDAVSLPLLIEDLGKLLRRKQLQATGDEFEKYLAQTSSGQARSESQKFWSSYLAESQPVNIAKNKQNRSSQRVEIFQRELLPSIKTIEPHIRKAGLNLQSVFFAAWAKIYYKHASQHDRRNTDVAVGVYFSNRSHLDNMLDLRDPTVNLIPLLVRNPSSKKLLELAKEVQHDLKEVGMLERSAVSLRKISEWTGVKLDTFVNFLRLPESMDDTASGETVIQALDDRREVERAQVVRVAEDKKFVRPAALNDLPDWTDIYRDSLDVEMTVAHGSLDVGLFGLENLAAFGEAKQMLQDLKKELQEAFG